MLIQSIVARVSSTAPKLPWNDFLQVLQVFMLGSDQERESDIDRAFEILDQGKRGLFGRTVGLPDGLISADELRAFLAILTDEVLFILIEATFIYLSSLFLLVSC